MHKQLEYLIHDLRRRNIRSIKSIYYAIFEQAVWATINYRFRRILYSVEIPIAKQCLRFITIILFKISEIFMGVSISSETEIGPGLYIGHSGVIIIHQKVIIGKNLNIGQLVTIGERGAGHDDQVPVIGDNVYIGVGAKILGGIRIGNNVKIGANAVVVHNIPDDVTAVGIPAKIINSKRFES